MAQFYRAQQYKMYPILDPIILFEKKGRGVLKAPPPLPMHFSNITRALLSIYINPHDVWNSPLDKHKDQRPSSSLYPFNKFSPPHVQLQVYQNERGERFLAIGFILRTSRALPCNTIPFANLQTLWYLSPPSSMAPFGLFKNYHALLCIPIIYWQLNQIKLLKSIVKILWGM